jgi:serine/threonine protein kinase
MLLLENREGAHFDEREKKLSMPFSGNQAEPNCPYQDPTVSGTIVTSNDGKQDAGFADDNKTKTVGAAWGEIRKQAGIFVKDDTWLKRGEVTIDKDRLLGKGHFGKVYYGSRQGDEVACKTLSESSSSHREVVRELSALVECTRSYHDNVMQLHGLWQDELNDGAAYIIMEYCDGGSARSFLRRQKLSKVEHLELARAWGRGIAAGMEHVVTAGFVHRDLRLENVMLKNGKPKIADLGLTRPAQPGVPFHDSGSSLPKAWYAPEAIRSFCFHLEFSDMWSFGCVMYEILSRGVLPWMTEVPDETPREDLPAKWMAVAKECILDENRHLERPATCPVEWWAVIKDCMKQDFEERPTFHDMHVALEALDVPSDENQTKTGELPGSSNRIDDMFTNYDDGQEIKEAVIEDAGVGAYEDTDGLVGDANLDAVMRSDNIYDD